MMLLSPADGVPATSFVPSMLSGPIATRHSANQCEQYVRSVTTHIGLTMFEDLYGKVETGTSHLWTNEQWLNLYRYMIKKSGLFATGYFLNVVALDMLMRASEYGSDPATGRVLRESSHGLRNAVATFVPQAPMAKPQEDEFAGSIRSHRTLLVADLYTRIRTGRNNTAFIEAGLFNDFNMSKVHVIQLYNTKYHQDMPAAQRYVKMFEEALKYVTCPSR